MLGMEEILCELDEHAAGGLLPPGFRFHPTDEELITFYLASKVFDAASAAAGTTTAAVEIAEVDLNRCEPWELPDAAKMGEREWYFFSLRDRKYPTGLRTNRATGAGYWKATGKDREVYGSSGVGGEGALLGMKKTLVFYKGRAPRGEKTKWVMHEYRLDGDFSCRHTGKEEWVICRIFHKIGDKKNPTIFLHQPQQDYMFPNPNSLPPLLEPPPLSQSYQDDYPAIMQTLNQNLQNPFLNNVHHTQEDYPSELKALINPLNILQSSDNVLKRPFLPNQDFTFRELSNAIAKQCKKEAGFDNELAHFQLLSGGNAPKWAGTTSTISQDSSFLFGLGGEMGLIPSTTTVLDHHDHANANGLSTQPDFKWW